MDSINQLFSGWGSKIPFASDFFAGNFTLFGQPINNLFAILCGVVLLLLVLVIVLVACLAHRKKARRAARTSAPVATTVAKPTASDSDTLQIIEADDLDDTLPQDTLPADDNDTLVVEAPAASDVQSAEEEQEVADVDADDQADGTPAVDDNTADTLDDTAVADTDMVDEVAPIDDTAVADVAQEDDVVEDVDDIDVVAPVPTDDVQEDDTSVAEDNVVDSMDDTAEAVPPLVDDTIDDVIAQDVFDDTVADAPVVDETLPADDTVEAVPATVTDTTDDVLADTDTVDEIADDTTATPAVDEVADDNAIAKDVVVDETPDDKMAAIAPDDTNDDTIDKDTAALDEQPAPQEDVVDDTPVDVAVEPVDDTPAEVVAPVDDSPAEVVAEPVDDATIVADEQPAPQEEVVDTVDDTPAEVVAAPVDDTPIVADKQPAAQEAIEEPVDTTAATDDTAPVEPATSTVADDTTASDTSVQPADTIVADTSAQPADTTDSVAADDTTKQADKPAPKAAPKAATAKTSKPRTTAKKPAPAKKTVATKEEPMNETTAKEPKKVIGSYEITLCIDGYRFMLYANNKQLLYESTGFTSVDGALKGIETFRKTVAEAAPFVSKDKYDRYRYIFNKRYQGENYTTKAQAAKCAESVKRFAPDAKVVVIDPTPEELEIYNQRRASQRTRADVDWDAIAKEEAAAKKMGKLLVADEVIDGEIIGYRYYMIANNGQILYTSAIYASAKTALSGIDAFKRAIYIGNVYIDVDKFGHYRYIVRGEGNATYMGESYTTKAQAESSAQSVRKFAACATIIPYEKKEDAE